MSQIYLDQNGRDPPYQARKTSDSSLSGVIGLEEELRRRGSLQGIFPSRVHKVSSVSMNEETVHMPSLIAKKRDGRELSDAEIEFFVEGVVSGQIQESQLGE